MGIGSEMAMDAMIDAMVEEDRAADEARAMSFEILRGAIRRATTVAELKNTLLVLTSMMENHT